MRSCGGRSTSSGRRTLWLFVFIAAAVCTAGCGKQGEHPAPVKAAGSEDRTFNDAARFLAGLPSRPGSAYSGLESAEAWTNYAQDLQKAWSGADSRRFQPVRDFQARELASGASGKFVFYPFSGPDAIYAQAFYPDAEVYVLAGLERPGRVPAPADFSKEKLQSQLDGIRRGSGSLIAKSFFVTGEMSRQLRGQLVDGVLPVILLLLARTGNTVDNVRNVAIDAQGKLVTMEAAQAKAGDQPDGLEVLYHKDGEEKQRTLYYFRLDLGPGLDKNPSFLTFLDQFGKPRTLIKSASFLLHWNAFARLRDYILNNSTEIVQDDTGVRFEVLRAKHWKVRLYGDYGRPDRPFQSQFQKDLREAFDEPGRAKPLGFAMGYGIGRRASHLIVADRP